MNNNIYDPKNIFSTNTEDDYIDSDDVISLSKDRLFHIGQSYEDKPARYVYCKICGGVNFNVGRGSYFTAIKCISCDYELCIHEG